MAMPSSTTFGIKNNHVYLQFICIRIVIVVQGREAGKGPAARYAKEILMDKRILAVGAVAVVVVVAVIGKVAGVF